VKEALDFLRGMVYTLDIQGTNNQRGIRDEDKTPEMGQ
jgi:hypothetical protein